METSDIGMEQWKVMEQQQMEQLMEQQMVLHIAMEPSTQMVTADTMIVHFQ